MGKIRVKTLGDEELEQEQKNQAKKKHEAKKTVKVAGMKGGERVIAVGPTEEELEALEKKEAKQKVEAPEEKKETKKKVQIKRKKAFHSQRYQGLIAEVDRTKIYPLKEALELLGKLQRKSFDETVELHINTLSPGITGQITLPHGAGKKTRVAIASDALIAEIEKGNIDFDVLVASPEMMPKLAKVARILGPKGLMPNPKNGTVNPKPEEVAKKFEAGQISFKTEKAPIIHLTVGKISFGPTKLSENIDAFINAIKKQNIRNATLKSTMSPGIKIRI